MNKNEEHIALIAVGLLLLWWFSRSSRLAYTPTTTTGTVTGGGLLGSLTNFFNGAGNLLRGIGGTSAPSQSIVAGDHTGSAIGADDLAPVGF